VIRALTIGTLIAATALVAIVMFDGGGGYKVHARFENAGQVVRGGLVEIAGKKVGTVTGQRLTDDGLAELELDIDEDWAPLPRGTHAQIRQFGLSGPASRYVELQLPRGGPRGELPDGAVLGLDDTTANVDLDEIFAIFNRRTRRSLSGVIRGSARQYDGEGERANEGWLYLDPAIVSASRLFGELNRDSDELRRFLTETSQLVGDVAERRNDLASLVSNLADTTGAIARPRRSPPPALHAPRQHHLREPARDAGRPRPAGRGGEAGGAQAPPVYRGAARPGRGRGADHRRPGRDHTPPGPGQ
jgi:phospholipid/cholesterol/gamma-HCH transport system substrate-binding protein